MPEPAPHPACPCTGERLIEAAALLQVLANEYRLMIITCLFSHRELNTVDLVERLGVSRTVLARHVNTLRRSGILAEDRRHNAVYFRLDNDKIAPIARALGLT